jgi:predicted HNH restriction endonuclease
MNVTPSTEQFVDMLRHAPLTDRHRSAILGVYSFPQHRASAPQLATLLGNSRYSKANLAFGGAGHAVSDYLGLRPPEWKEDDLNWWSILSTWDRVARTWQLLPELIEAIEITGFGKDSPFDTHPDDAPVGAPLREGATTTVTVTLYERSAVARRKCVEHYGCSCCVCGFSFESAYGELGRDYIHVHHVVPLAEVDEEYEVDPVRDLRPVCPNCHAMLHRKSPAFSVEELKEQVSPNKKNAAYG